MKTPPTLTEDERAELVAFLDGELTDAEARTVEARINVEPAYRAEAQSLDRAWKMLDYLPKPEPTPQFTERTLSRIAPGPATRTRKPPPHPGKKGPWFWPTAAFAWLLAIFVMIGVGYAGYGRLVPREPGDADLVRDLRLIENKKAFDNVEDFEFLERLAHPDLFGDDNAGPE